MAAETNEPLLHSQVVAPTELCPEQPQPPASSYLRQELIELLRKLVGETLACFMVVFTIIAVKVNLDSLNGDEAASLLVLAVSGGVVTTVAIFTLSHVSGSHINPAVTIAYTLIHNFPLQLAPLYICAQLLGGIVASLVLEVVYKPDWQVVLVTPIGTVLQAVLAEAVAGFLLLFVCASVVTDIRAIGHVAGVAIGAVIALNIIVVGPISGGGLNPSRVLGPAFVSGDFTHVWIYLVGPIGGAIFGALMYLPLRPREVKKKGVHKAIDVREVTKGLSSRFHTARTKPTPSV